MHSVAQLWLIWKSSIKIYSLNPKQCPAGLSPRIICSTHEVWTDPLSPEPLWETLRMGKNPTQKPKIYPFAPSEKSSLLDLNLSLLKVSFFIHQIATFKYSLHATFICSGSHFCCIIFQISDFMCTHVMLIWLINVHWMLTLAWQKHWIIEALPSKIPISSTFLFPPFLQCYFENPASVNACFPLFHAPFLFQTLWNFNSPHSSWGFMAYGLIKYNGFQISGNKSYETPYLMP